MRRLMNCELSDKDKMVLEIVKYFLTSLWFFPISFILWYLSKRDKIRFYCMIAAISVISFISLTSYIYVLHPLDIKFRTDFGIYGAVVYGGIFSIFFWASRFFSPIRESMFLLIIYYIGYVFSVVIALFLTVIPRYYIVCGFDKGSFFLSISALSWLIISFLINYYSPPIKNEVISFSSRDRIIRIAALWILSIANCALLRLICYVFKRLC